MKKLIILLSVVFSVMISSNISAKEISNTYRFKKFINDVTSEMRSDIAIVILYGTNRTTDNKKFKDFDYIIVEEDEIIPSEKRNLCGAFLISRKNNDAVEVTMELAKKIQNSDFYLSDLEEFGSTKLGDNTKFEDLQFRKAEPVNSNKSDNYFEVEDAEYIDSITNAYPLAVCIPGFFLQKYSHLNNVEINFNITDEWFSRNCEINEAEFDRVFREYNVEYKLQPGYYLSSSNVIFYSVEGTYDITNTVHNFDIRTNAFLMAANKGLGTDFKINIRNTNKQEKDKLIQDYSITNYMSTCVLFHLGLLNDTEIRFYSGTKVKGEVIANVGIRISLSNIASLDFEPSESIYNQARLLGLCATACASFADSDYISTMVQFLSDTDNSYLNSMFGNINSTDENISKIMKILYSMSKYKQPLYFSNTDTASIRTDAMNNLTLGDLEDAIDITVYVSSNDTQNQNVSSSSKLKQKDIEDKYEIEFSDEGNLKSISDCTLKALNSSEDKSRSEILQYMFANSNNNNLGPDEKVGESSDYKHTKNKILRINRNGYKEKDKLSYINYLYINKLSNNYTLNSKVSRGTPLFSDAFGNIVTEDNILIFPAISNGTLMRDTSDSNLLVFFQSKAFYDAFSTWVEINKESYEYIKDEFTFKEKQGTTSEHSNTSNSQQSDVNDILGYKYEFVHDFIFETRGSKKYMRIIPKNIPFNSGETIIASSSNISNHLQKTNVYIDEQAYLGENKPNIVSFIKYFVESKYNNEFKGVKTDGSTVDLDIGQTKSSPSSRYIINTHYINECVLCGYDYNTIQQCTKKILNDSPLNVGSMLLMRIVSNVDKSLLRNAPSYLSSNAVYDEQLYLSIVQVLLIIAIFVGSIFMLIAIIKSFTIKKAILVIIMYTGTILLIANLRSITVSIDSHIQRLFLGNTQNVLILNSLIESDLDKKYDIDRIVSVDKSEARIKISEESMPIINYIKSIISDNGIDLQEKIHEINSKNLLYTNGGSIAIRNLLTYYIDILEYGRDIGIRTYRDTNGIKVRFTRTQNSSVPNYYLSSNIIMELVSRRLNSMIQREQIVPQSNVDRRASVMYSDNAANNTYGLTKYYLDKSTQISKIAADSGVCPYTYDYTGLYEFITELYNQDIIPNNQSVQDSDVVSYLTQNMYFNSKSSINDGLLSEYCTYEQIDKDKTVKELLVFGENENYTDLIQTYGIINTEWGNFIYSNPMDQRIINAIDSANKEFIDSLEYVSDISTSTNDKNLLLFASLNASLAFNRELGLTAKDIDLSYISNDTILKMILGGRASVLFTSGKTNSRFYFENYKDVIPSFVILFNYIMFTFVCYIKHILLFIALLVFLYSVSVNGIVTYNVEGLLGGVILYIGINAASVAILQVFTLVAEITNNIYLMSVILLIFNFTVIVISFTVSKKFLDNAVSGGFDVVKNFIVGMYNGAVGRVASLVNDKLLNGALDTDRPMTYGTEQQYGMNTPQQEVISNIDAHYTNLRDNALATPEIVVDADFVEIPTNITTEEKPTEKKYTPTLLPVSVDDFQIRRE